MHQNSQSATFLAAKICKLQDGNASELNRNQTNNHERVESIDQNDDRQSNLPNSSNTSTSSSSSSSPESDTLASQVIGSETQTQTTSAPNSIAGGVSRDSSSPTIGSTAKKRRSRTTFSASQVEILEAEYQKLKYPNVTVREEIARRTYLNESRVQVSFALLLNLFCKTNLNYNSDYKKVTSTN